MFASTAKRLPPQHWRFYRYCVYKHRSRGTCRTRTWTPQVCLCITGDDARMTTCLFFPQTSPGCAHARVLQSYRLRVLLPGFILITAAIMLINGVVITVTILNHNRYHHRHHLLRAPIMAQPMRLQRTRLMNTKMMMQCLRYRGLHASSLGRQHPRHRMRHVASALGTRRSVCGI